LTDAPYNKEYDMAVINKLDPQLLAVVKQVPIIDMANIPVARAALHAVFAQVNTVPANPEVERCDYSVPRKDANPAVSLRVFRPVGITTPLPCLYWIQGGGYVLTAPDLDDSWCETIAHDQQCVVVSVNWRRAPEHPFPAAINDCYDGLAWAVEHASQLAIDRARIVIGGASSGGGAAAALALKVRDLGEFTVVHQLLIYPMLDDTNSTVSSQHVTDPELWNRTSNELAWRAYLGDAYGRDDVSPYAAPARMLDLSRLPSATVLTGEHDLFRDENIQYAQRLMHAGIKTELHVYPGAHHGFDRHVPGADVSLRFFSDRDNALRLAFSNVR
jgi:acetyl esterase/lipase